MLFDKCGKQAQGHKRSSRVVKGKKRHMENWKFERREGKNRKCTEIRRDCCKNEETTREIKKSDKAQEKNELQKGKRKDSEKIRMKCGFKSSITIKNN